MKSTPYIQLEGIDTDKQILNRPDILHEIYNQTKNPILDPDRYILGIIRNFYDDTQLPLQLDYIFQMDNTKICEQSNFTIRACINNGTKFHTKLWKGYNHLAIIEIDSKNSTIFQELKPMNNRKRWDPIMILCKSIDAEQCKISVKEGLEKHDCFMKENNYERWLFLKKEEEDYKNK